MGSTIYSSNDNSSADDSGIELSEKKSLLDKSHHDFQQDKPARVVAHTLISTSKFRENASIYGLKWDIDEAEILTISKMLRAFYDTFNTPIQHQPHDLESLRVSRLISLYQYLLAFDDIEPPFKTLMDQCDSILRIYLQVLPDAELEEAIAEYQAKKVFKPDLIAPLPEMTSSARDLDDHARLDELLQLEEKETSLTRQEEIRLLLARITSQDPDQVTEGQRKKLIGLDKERRYRRYLQPKKILDLFKKGTYGVVGARYQHQLKEQNWHICNQIEREDYRVYADYNDPQLLQQLAEGEGDNRQLSFTLVTTEHKKAFVNHPEKQGDDEDIFPSYFDNTGMFVIDADGRMYLFSADDHEDGLTPASLMKCEPVLFAGSLKIQKGEFELLSNSKEYKTNQRMSRLAVHYLATQARVLPENAIVNSAPIKRTVQAKMITQSKSPQKIERAKTQVLNLAIYSEDSDLSVYSETKGLYWHLRPDMIFPTDGTILDADYLLDEEAKTDAIKSYQAIKAYIAKRFNLPSANAVWQITPGDFDQLLLELNDRGEAKELRDKNGDIIELPASGISESQREKLEQYYQHRQVGKNDLPTDFFNEELVRNIYKAMFDSEDIQNEFEEEAQNKGFSHSNLDAIWNLGSRIQFEYFLSRLLENRTLLTAAEYADFSARAHIEGNPVKAAKFDELIATDNLPKETPQHFEDDEFAVITEANALVDFRKNLLTEYYYSRRQISSTPEQNLSHFMYGEIYADCKKHPWYKDRIGPYLAFIVAGVILGLIITSIILFAPELMALTICCVMNFFTIVFVGYLIGITAGGLVGTAVAFITDLLLEPKPVEVPEKIYDYDRARFYRLPEANESTDEVEDSFIDEKNLFVETSFGQ